MQNAVFHGKMSLQGHSKTNSCSIVAFEPDDVDGG